MSEGKFEINEKFVGRWTFDEREETLNIYVVPFDPKRSVFHGVVNANDEGGYTKYDQSSDAAKETVAALVAEAALPEKYIQDVEVEKVAKEGEWKAQRIFELEAELASLKGEEVVKEEAIEVVKG